MYGQASLGPPHAIVWCGSPFSQALTCAIVQDEKLLKQMRAGVGVSVGDSVGPRVRAGVWASVRANVRASVSRSAGAGVRAGVGGRVRASVSDSVRARVSDSVRDGVEARVRDSAGASVWASVRGSVRASVRASIGDGVGSSVWDRVKDSVWARVSASVWESVWDSVSDRGENRVWACVDGAHDTAWLAYYRYFRDVLGLVDQTAKLSGLWELAQSAGWALPYENICWVSERHHILERDDRGLLHSLAGPACAYPDGWAIYAVHGVRVPRYLIERPREISVKRIDAEQNAEVRRIMIQRYRHGEEIAGPAAFLRDSGGERLDHDESYGTLWRRNVPDDEPIVMIEVVNRTPEPDGRFKRYWLRVPPTMRTAHEAVAWTFDMPAEQYAPELET
jgi:hypothetical protein